MSTEPSLEDLRELLTIVAEARQSVDSSGAIHLESSLVVYRPYFANLLKDQPKNQTNREAIKAGKATIQGTTYRLNDEFSKQVLYLSDQLDIDEFEATRLLLNSGPIATRSNNSTIDTAVYVYHAERGYILSVLNNILEMVKDVYIDAQVRFVCYQFIKGLLEDKDYIDKMIKSAKKLASMMDSITKTGALASVPAQPQQNIAGSTTTTGQIGQQQPQQLGSSLFGQPQQQSSVLGQTQQTSTLFGQNKPQTTLFGQPQPQQQTNLLGQTQTTGMFGQNRPQQQTGMFGQTQQQQLQQQQLQQQQQQHPQVNTPKFSNTTSSLRIDKLGEERVFLGQILYHLASVSWLTEKDMKCIVEELKTATLTDNFTAYLLTTFMTAISQSYPNIKNYRFGKDISTDVTLLKSIQEIIKKNEGWKVPEIQAVLKLAWSIQMTKFVKNTPAFEEALSMNETERLELATQATSAQVFVFMNKYLLYFKQENADIESVKDYSTDGTEMAVDSAETSDFTKCHAQISLEFRKQVVHELEHLVERFISHMGSLLTRLRYNEEQVNIQNPIGSKKIAYVTTEPNPNHDLEAFYLLLASIYRDRINAGLLFWDRDNGLFQFVKWTADIKLAETVRACFDFLGSISTGDECANKSFAFFEAGTNRTEFMNGGLFSWGKLVGCLQYYTELLQGTEKASEASVISIEEEGMLCKFLYILQQVVLYSEEKRQQMLNDGELKVVDSVLGLMSCPTSTRLRASLFNVLAAFCSDWGGGINGLGRTVSLQMWSVLNDSDFFNPKKRVIQSISSTGNIGNLDNKKSNDVTVEYLPSESSGFIKELAVEKQTKIYTETLAVIRLIASMIHTQSKRDKLISGFTYAPSSVPVGLGQYSLSPGTAPFISLIIDHVFLNLDQFRYVYPDAKWQLADACLCMMENSVMSLDLQPLLDFVKIDPKLLTYMMTATDSHGEKFEKALLVYVSHPGFDIITRILSGSHLFRSLFKLTGQAKVDTVCDKNTSPYFVKSIKRCLNIFSRILSIQNDIVNLLVPLIKSKATPGANISEFRLGKHSFPTIPALSPLGQLMLYDTQAIVRIAFLVDCQDKEEICYAATNILSALSTEPEEVTRHQVASLSHANIPMGGIGSKLAATLASSPEAASIIIDFSDRVEIESTEMVSCDDYEYDINNIPFWRAKNTLENVHRYSGDWEPSLASSVRIAILDTLIKNTSKDRPSATLSEFLLGYNTIEGIASEKPKFSSQEPRYALFHTILEMVQLEGGAFTSTHPILAEKCYQLLYKLCCRESTASYSLDYLGGQFDFFYSQFKAMPPRLEDFAEVNQPEFPGMVVSFDGSRFKSDFFKLRALLHQRAWFLQLLALELHNGVKSRQRSEINRLLGLLFGSREYSQELPEQFEGLGIYPDKSGFKQPLWSLLEMMHSLEFTWEDEMANQPTSELIHFKNYVKSEVTSELSGCKLLDVKSIYRALRTLQFEKEKNGITKEHSLQMEIEMGYILHKSMAENHSREIAHARLHCLSSWKQLIQVTLSDCFDFLAFESREKIIHDLLLILLNKIQQTETIQTDLLEGLSKIILTLLARLGDDRRHQAVLHVKSDTTTSTSASILPTERLRTVLTDIINCILGAGAMATIRSDMYTALTNLLHDIIPHQTNETTKQVINILNERKDGLLKVITQDASDAHGLWKTTAYMTLESLYALFARAGNTSIHSYLVKENFLKYTIDMVKRSDAELLNILEKPDVSLIPLYTYEAEMSLFMQLALTKNGAALLLNNGIIDSLTCCKFINTRPAQTVNPDGKNSTFNELYERMLSPVLEMNIAIYTSLGHIQGFELSKIEEWAKKQDILVHILRDEGEMSLYSLRLLRLVTLLFYEISCQPGYFKESHRTEELDTIMSRLIAKYCFFKDLAKKVVPVTGEEKKWAKESVSATFNGAEVSTKLAIKADKYIIDITKSLLAYAQNAIYNNGSTGSFHPIFANTLTVVQELDPLSFQNASSKTPSLTTLVVSLSYYGKRLQNAITEYNLLSSQKGNEGSLKYEEVREIASTAIPAGLGIKYDSLNPTQQYQVLATEIQTRKKSKLKELSNYLFVTQTALSLLWRHIEFYLQPKPTSPKENISPCDPAWNNPVQLRQQTLFQPSSVVAHNLKASSQVLGSLLTKLESLDLSSVPKSVSMVEFCKRIRKHIE
ncbi:hypothetical protein K501DRAFT_209766 [Backusella circina FSU 941]|nr:hypothetical protein K501DRAFT_209766 [Backusella circina FSU 941]